jgi:EVE domain
MAYWIFKYNPAFYRLDDRLADPDPDITWTVSRYRDEIAPGDTIFIWQTGRDRGIRAILRAEAAPEDMAEIESELPYWTQGENDICCRVRATIIDRDVNLPHTELRTVPGLENLSVFHGFQQTSNFPVTPDEGAILLELIRGRHGRAEEPRS